MPAPTVAYPLFDAVFQYLDQLGYCERSVCDTLNIQSKAQYRNHNRIPLSLYQQAFIAGEILTGDSAFGMRMGSTGYPEKVSIFYLLTITAKDIKQIMSSFSRFLPIAYDFIQLDSFSTETHLRNRFRFEGPRPHRHVVEYITTHWFSTANRLNFTTQNVPRTIYFANPRCCEKTLIERIFNSTEVHFNQAQDCFDLNIQCLDYHSVTNDPGRFLISESEAENQLIRLRSEDRITREISQLLSAMIETRTPTIEEIAKKMNCSGRTLQRRLAERNLSYQMLLDSVRKDLAIHLLANTNLPITKIANRTGFTDDSTFHRAFKRWTGAPAGQFRSQ